MSHRSNHKAPLIVAVSNIVLAMSARIRQPMKSHATFKTGADLSKSPWYRMQSARWRELSLQMILPLHFPEWADDEDIDYTITELWPERSYKNVT